MSQQNQPVKESNPSPATPKLELPAVPASETGAVKAWSQPVEMLTYLPAAPDPNPMFLERRVYQGSSGQVYPLPFIDRIDTVGKMHAWQAIHIENPWIRLMILPEIGGRIHVGLDKTTGYDFFYRQNVIKPALVGLAGPWVSGGVEFNWPQHHRPATFMPVETEVERHSDGSITVWCSDYDRASGMKGMHGVCLHPDRAIVELKARLYNGTEATQTFLWWANVAARVHEHYQSFFPPDVHYVADHAKRAISSFPLADGSYYGVDYKARADHGVSANDVPSQFQPTGYPANDLSRYANIPVPTSYMIVQTEGDFFGGYDHAANAGFVHVASHHISPGKKQWTWGNHDFGYAWDRCLTEEDGPYVELMAGVYTDNQPDFSYLAPGETKTFSQFWYPLRNSGIPQIANLQAALSLTCDRNKAHIALCVTQDFADLIIHLSHDGQQLAQWQQPVTIRDGFSAEHLLPANCDPARLSVQVFAASNLLIEYAQAPQHEKPAPPLAVEPQLPQDISSIDRLYLTGLHLEQYRHATRSPEPYWREALRRDPADTRCNHALAKFHLKRGEFAQAESHLRTAIHRATELNPNPSDGEIFYTLGLTLRRLHRLDEAYAAFYKSTWNAAMRSPGYHELAKIDALRNHLPTALNHLQLSLNHNGDNLNARNLLVCVKRALGHQEAANALLQQTRALDPLDLWSRYLDRQPLPANGHHLLALALLMEQAGQTQDAIQVLKQAIEAPADGSLPLALIALARCYESINDSRSEASLQSAAEAPTAYCFPSGLDHQALLEYAVSKQPNAARFHYYEGNLLHHHQRHTEAIAAWQRSVELDPSNAQAWRNLGIAQFNTLQDAEAAQHSFDQARAASPQDARILYERDQLQKRLGVNPAQRLAGLLEHQSLVDSRDDLCVELATLYNQLDRPHDALDTILARHFQPWEGGEGLVLAQYTTAHLRLGQAALAHNNPAKALEHFTHADYPPVSLGEARHLLANNSNIHYWLGEALTALGDDPHAAEMYERAARQQGDFQSMATQPFSEMTWWSGLALERLGHPHQARELFERMLAYASELASQPAKIDYFATSLPTLLLFEDNLEQRQQTRASLLRAVALIGLGDSTQGQQLLQQVLASDPNNLFALQLIAAPAIHDTMAAVSKA